MKQAVMTGAPRRSLARRSCPACGTRIFAACDTLDALTVDRPYRKAVPFSAALAYVQSAAGTLFDPEVAAEMAAAREEMSPYVGRIML